MLQQTIAAIFSHEPSTSLPIFHTQPFDRTGYGGLLLVTDVLGDVLAYDLACPYEARPGIRVSVPKGELFAECPVCGSTYDIFTNYGKPRSGPASDKGYSLTRYSVVSGGATEYKVVTR